MPTTYTTTGNLWTPGEVIAVISVISSVFLTALVAAIVKIIEAAKTARIAVIEATKAAATTHSNTEQLKSLQQQVTSVALSQVPTPQAMAPGLAQAVVNEIQRRDLKAPSPASHEASA